MGGGEGRRDVKRLVVGEGDREGGKERGEGRRGVRKRG